MKETQSDKKIREYILENISDKRVASSSDPFWQALRNSGTNLWLDTGDIDEAMEVWSAEMEALTTNNTLINRVIQKGDYDDYIARSAEMVAALPRDEMIMELAFILNARHGLRLASIFGGKVSVELHTSTAHNIDDIVKFGLRYHSISPDRFFVKVPYTAAGLIGARILKEKGVHINLTLGFSARQNVVVAHIAQPDYLNVFLGRIGAYISDNKLGGGEMAGEKSVIETQRNINRINKANGYSSRLIAASLRHHSQLEALAGTDLFTIPPKVALNGRKELSGNFSSQINSDYQPDLNDGEEKGAISSFWRVDPEMEKIAIAMGKDLPSDGDALAARFRDAGFADMFPQLDKSDMEYIASDGKIPLYSRWKSDISEGRIAPDTLLNLAGLASFTVDQGELDARIDKMLPVTE